MLANLSPMLQIHFVAAIVSLVIGAAQMIAAKGTRRHAAAGRLYVAAMLVTNIGALTSYQRGINLFHVFAILSLYALATGLLALRTWQRTRAPEALRSHKIQMGFSYLGLAMAGVSQFAVNPRFGLVGAMPPLAFWTSFAVLNIVMYAAGSWWIFARLAPASGERGETA